MMKWFNNLRISSKLILGFVIVALIAGIVGVVGVVNIKNIATLDEELYEQNTVPLTQLDKISVAFQRIRVSFLYIIIDNTQKDKHMGLINDDDKTINDALDIYSKTISSNDEQKEYDKLKDLITQYNKIRSNAINYAVLDQKQQALKVINDELGPLGTEISDTTDKLSLIKLNLAKEKSDGNTATANSATVIMVVIILVGMAVAIGFGLFTARIISRPIAKVVAGAEKIADGDLDVVIDIQSKDEVGVLANTFNNMAGKINEVMTNINSSAEQVAAGSRQVSASSQALSQGSTEQASSIEEVTATMEEVSSQTKQNAINAGQANELAISAKENAVSGNDQMRSMLKSMEEINEASSNISKIIKVIDEIAFQTNILALNAAVEAARAGQHGKGFAVVAEEVRNLAARSANAAKETTMMIEGSITKVSAGTKIANDTAQALNKIVDGVAKAAALVGDIAMASNEQASAIAQVNQAITQVSEVVQTNSATAEESAAASEELSSQAELLKELVGQFKLRKGYASNNHYDNMSPEIVKMIDHLIEQKGPMERNKTKQNNAVPAVNRQKVKISLDDKDFGKY